MNKSFHGVTVFKCYGCGEDYPIDIRLQECPNSKEWQELFLKIQLSKLKCEECKNVKA